MVAYQQVDELSRRVGICLHLLVPSTATPSPYDEISPAGITPMTCVKKKFSEEGRPLNGAGIREAGVSGKVARPVDSPNTTGGPG